MKQLVQNLKKVLGKNKEIIDIIVFGSIAKGSLFPNDIDIAIISQEKIKAEIKQEIMKQTNKETDIQIINLNDYDKYIWLTLIKEGYSVKHRKYLSEMYRIKPKVLFKYSLKSLTNSKKVMFERAIKSFDNIEKLSNRVVLVPTQEAGEFTNFLRRWELDIDTTEYELLPLMRKE